jgi:putative MATE family efflux protein
MGQRASGFWTSVREALSGSERDYTQGSVDRAILMLAVPMVLEMAMESLFALVDIFWVAKLGKSAAAAVGLTESIETLVYAVAVGISAGATAMVARRIGEKDPDGAALSAVQALIFGIATALAIGIPGAVLAPKLLGWMGADQEVIAVGSGFTRLVQASNPIIVLLFLMNAIFRGAGDAAIAMRVLWVANIINILLDPCFIYGIGPFPELGVTGAAVATTIGRGVGVGLQVYALFHNGSRVRIGRRHLRLDREILLRLARVSFTGMVQYLIPNGSWLALVRIVSMFGSSALAGYTIAIRIVIFSILPSWGLSNAAATLVGQNLGARQPERAEQSVWKAGLYNMVFLGVIGVLFISFPGWLVGWFTEDLAVRSIAADCLRIVSYGYLFYAYGMVMAQAFNGAGDTTTPTWINLGCYWCLQIPLAWFLASGTGLEALGAFWAVPAAESVLAIVSILIFRRGDWKRRQI